MIIGLITEMFKSFLVHAQYMKAQSIGLSSITNPKPRGKPSQSLLRQTYANPAKGGRYLALRTRGALLSHDLVPWELSLPT